MIVKRRTTGDVELDQKTLDEFRTSLRGVLVLSNLFRTNKNIAPRAP